MDGFLEQKPSILRSSAEQFESLKKIDSFNMTFDDNILQKIHHAIGVVNLIKEPYPIYLSIQDIFNEPNIYVKIEENSKKKDRS